MRANKREDHEADKQPERDGGSHHVQVLRV
jgi:hypothetical protein